MENKISQSRQDADGSSAELLSRWADFFPDKDLDALAFQIFAIRIGNLLTQRQEQSCRDDYGLNAAHVSVLVALLRLEGTGATSPGKLHRNLLVTPGAITKQVDRLVQHKLAERRQHPTDKREVIIQLTPSGRSIACEAIASRIDSTEVKSALQILGQQETKMLITAMGKMLAALESRPNDKDMDGLRHHNAAR